MRTRRAKAYRSRVLDRVDALIFAFTALAAVWLAYLLIKIGVDPGWPLLLLVAFWGVFTYLLLPRVHRILTRLYTPDYFIGRTRTADGLLGDPVNLALRGAEAQVHVALQAAGWVRADDLGAKSTRRMITSTLRRRSYPSAPVSALLLFDRQHDFAYQKEVGGSTSKRHHVRFWRCPTGWRLPGGFRVDWIGAGTFDRSVGFSLFTFQVTHKIERDTDIERDFIVDEVVTANPTATFEVIEGFAAGYHARNGGGDVIKTDGDLPIVDLTNLSAPAPESPPTDSRNKRPWQTVFGGGTAVVRGLVYIAVAVLYLTDAALAIKLEPDQAALIKAGGTTFLMTVCVVLFTAAVIDIGLGLLVLAGRNWARLGLMTASIVSTIASFVRDVDGSEVAQLINLPAIGGSVLVLLALSGPRAREYASRATKMAKQYTEHPT